MKGAEWARLILVTMACNGWWAFATWPTFGEAPNNGPSILLVVGIVPTLVLAIWGLVGICTEWEG